MGQTTNKIAAHIEETRADLGTNLHELEQKVKNVTDWKYQFQAHPMAFMGAALGGGILLAALAGGSKRHRGRRQVDTESYVSPQVKNEVMETWDNIKGALIGVAATRVKELVGEIVPGFHEHYLKAEDKAKH